MRFAPVTIVVLLLLAAASPLDSHADVVPGEYSLAMNALPDQAPLGSEFLVTLEIHHNAGPYQAVEWRGEFDPTSVQGVAAYAHRGAPPECATNPTWFAGGATLHHCLSVLGPNLTYDGAAHDLVFKCLQLGVATFTLTQVDGPAAQTFVKVGTTQHPVHTHNDAVTCTNDVDTDGDGCTDASEAGANRLFGGQRDPNNKWDFFDVTSDRAIDASDVLDILQFFGLPASHAGANRRDRYIPDMAFPWRTAESNDGVDLSDALVNLQSYGADCLALS